MPSALEVQRLRQVIARGWSEATAFHGRFDPARPSANQCAVTAMVVQDELGGDILQTRVGRTLHFLNRLPDGRVIDLTADQFPPGAVSGELVVRSRHSLEGAADVQARYLRLRSRINRGLAGLRLRSAPGPGMSLAG